MDERYHLRFADGEVDDIEEIEPFVTYQQRKKPLTRRKYSEAVKLIYGGTEEYDYISEQPLRYRWNDLSMMYSIRIVIEEYIINLFFKF